MAVRTRSLNRNTHISNNFILLCFQASWKMFADFPLRPQSSESPMLHWLILFGSRKQTLTLCCTNGLHFAVESMSRIWLARIPKKMNIRAVVAYCEGRYIICFGDNAKTWCGIMGNNCELQCTNEHVWTINRKTCAMWFIRFNITDAIIRKLPKQIPVTPCRPQPPTNFLTPIVDRHRITGSTISQLHKKGSAEQTCTIVM